MNREQLGLRESLNAQRPDVTDPDNWPDIATLPGRLLPVLDLLKIQIDVARITGAPVDRLQRHYDIVTEAREALVALMPMSPLEAWRLVHPPQLDPLDHIHDCGHPDCPDTGFVDPANRALHHRRWRLSL